MPSPMPLLPPVTSTILPSSLPTISSRTRLGLSPCFRWRRAGGQAMEMITGPLAANAEAARAIGPAGQAALDLFADREVLDLYLMRHGNALGHELLSLRALGPGEIKIEDDAAAVGTERQNEVRVHHALVDVDHEIGKDPPVVGVVAATHAGRRGVVVGRVRRP